MNIVTCADKKAGAGNRIEGAARLQWVHIVCGPLVCRCSDGVGEMVSW